MMRRFAATLLGVGLTSSTALAEGSGMAAGEELAALNRPMLPLASTLSGASPSASPGLGQGSGIFSRLSLSWTGELNGPTLGPRSFGTNYNAFQNNHGPLYVYHTLSSAFQLTPSDQFGAGISAKQDFTGPVQGKFGEVKPEFTVENPQLWYGRRGLLETSWLQVDGQFSVYPGVTSYSREKDHLLFSTAIDGTYRIKLPASRWSLSFSSRIQPYIYDQGAPDSLWMHDQLFLSAGHFLSYSLSDRFQLASSSTFDRKYYKSGQDGSFVQNDANGDRTSLKLNYFTPSGLARFGAYIQSLIFEPRADTTIVGVDMTISFLTGQ